MDKLFEIIAKDRIRPYATHLNIIVWINIVDGHSRGSRFSYRETNENRSGVFLRWRVSDIGLLVEVLGIQFEFVTCILPLQLYYNCACCKIL